MVLQPEDLYINQLDLLQECEGRIQTLIIFCIALRAC